MDISVLKPDSEPVVAPLGRSSNGWRKLRTLSWQATVGLFIAATSVNLPPGFQIFVGPDESWISALYEAHNAGLHWGSQVVFTYGPLGFLEHPRFVRIIPGLIALGVQLVGLAAVAIGLARGWSRTIHPVLAWLLAYVVVASVGWTADVFVLALVGLVCSAAIDQSRRRDSHLPLWVAAAVGAFALVKLSTVPVVAILALAAGCLTWGRQRAARYALLPLVAVATFGGLWLLLGQRLSDIPDYASTSFELTTGYSQAMAIEQPGRAWEYWAAALITPLVLMSIGLAVARRRTESGSRFVVIGGVLMAALAVSFRLGFVRHDQHSITFFSGLLLIAVSVPPRSPTAWMSWRSPGINLAVALVCLGVLTTVAARPAGHLRGGPRRALDLVPTVADAANRGTVERANTELVRTGGLPRSFVERIGRDTVHVEPYQTALVQATGLHWQPAPVFQTYVAFTPALDQVNADAMAENGPAWILRKSGSAIDGRLWAWESPRYQVAVLCNYRVVERQEGWDLLERSSSSRCGPVRPITRRRPIRRPLTVPRSSDDAVLAQVTCPRSRLERTLQALFKPRHRVVAVTGAGQFQIVPEHLSSLLIVRSRDIQLKQLGLKNCAGEPTVKFFAMPVAP